MTASLAPRAGARSTSAPFDDEATLESDAWPRERVLELLHRRPAVGFALAVIRPGHPPFFHVHGLADIASGTPITEASVFRIGSVTKLFTAISVMQLAEEGRLDLDAPANDYLRAYRLVPADRRFRQPTVRHLLTHTAGVPEIRGLGDLLHSDLTPAGGRSAMPTVAPGEPLPPLSEVYRDGLRVVVEPGTAFAYSNHGFATLGQIVEDVSGEPLERFMREHIFGPLGLADTDLVRSDRVRSRLATGYTLGRRGPTAVRDREEIGAGGGSIYSTPRDLARFVAALLQGGSNEHGRVLRPDTLATMFEPHFQPDPRLPGVGLAFFRGEIGGHRTVGHDGIMPGFNSAVLLAPDDGIGLVALTNGSSDAFAWLQIELHGILAELLGVPATATETAVPNRPERWVDLCGRYVLQPRISDLRGRLMLGGGAQVFVGGGRLKVRVRTPVPALLRGFDLEPADPNDPDVFRLDLSAAGIGPVRVVFSRDGEGRVTAVHTDLGGQPWSLVRPEEPSRRARAVRGAVGGVIAAGVLTARRRRRSRHAASKP